jgi:endonuclease III
MLARVTRREKALRIAGIQEELFPRPGIPLDHRDPYTLLVAVVLSAQCTDERVNRVTPALFAVAPTPRELAALPVSRIATLIRSCGLAPTKARNLQALARRLLEQHGGEVPSSLEALEALPGVGHKTASVVLAQAFGESTFPVDTHIHRLARRWGLSSGRSVAQTESDLKRVFPPESWNKLHLQIIYFGRAHCPALRHDFGSCPICSWAASRATRTRERPRKPSAQRATSRAKNG